jgi:Protein of unknown function (DUF3632)
MEACFNGIIFLLSFSHFQGAYSNLAGGKDPSIPPMKLTPESAQIWRNLNAFGAQCLGAGLIGTWTQAMYALRSALEDNMEETDKMELRIQVACGWISYGARGLLGWALENVGYADITVDDTANYVEGGQLYHGPPTMCLRRWGFWLDRFEELGREQCGIISEDIRKAVLEAAQTMRTVETGVGSTLSA